MSDTGNHRGTFITLEGGEGAGKSSQIDLLRARLTTIGRNVSVTREPGGTNGAEILRHVILSGSAELLGSEIEAMLFAAARADHVAQVIRPALEQGKTVLCDRFVDSTRVYQGVCGDVDLDYLTELEKIACGDVWPDITLILDIDPKTGMERARKRRSADEPPDRFEKETMQQQQQRREAFLEIARQEPERCRVIDASGTQAQVAERIWKAVQPVLHRADA